MFGMNVYQYTKRIRECTKAGNMTGAMHLFKTMKREGVHPNVVSYNVMMDGFSKANDPDSVHRLFDAMILSGIKPTHYTFSITIQACSINADLKRAAHLFSSMQRHHALKPNAWTYNAMLHLCAVAGQLPLAKKCFYKLEKDAIKKDVVIYCSLIDAYAEATIQSNGRQHLNECLVLVEKMKTESIQPSRRTYAALIKLCTRARLAREAFELVKRMEGEGTNPDERVYTMLLDVLGKDASMSKEETATRMKWILNEMEKKRIDFELEIYTVVFTLCRKLDDLNLANSFLKRLEKSGLKPNDITYSALIKCYEQIGDPSNKEAYLKTCFHLAKEMKSVGLPLNVGVYTTLIVACARVKDVDRAYDIWNEARKKGVRGDIPICGAMISAFLQSNELKRARLFLRQMESTGVVRNSVICGMFMKHFEANQMKEEAKNFLREMKDLKIKWSESVNIVIKRLGLESI